jgi:hypothetical protein
MLQLNVSDEDPAVAAAIANAWAEEFVRAVEEVYGSGGVSFYTEQLEQARQQLQIAEDALVTFQTTNRQGLVENELLALANRQSAYLADQTNLNWILDNIEALRAQVESNTADRVALADQLTALTLQLQANTSVPAMLTPAPQPQLQPQLQLNIAADAELTTAERAVQLQRLDALRQSVEAALAEGQAQLDALEAPIFALQTEKQQLFNEGERLLRAREVAHETYLTVTRKIDEERVASRDTVTRLAGQAIAPDEPERPGLLMLVLLLSFAAAAVAVAFIIARTWLRGPQSDAH